MKVLFAKGKVEKYARKTLLTEICIIWFLIYLFFFLLIAVGASKENVSIWKFMLNDVTFSKFVLPKGFIILFIFFTILIIPYWFAYKQSALDAAYDMVSKEYSEKVAIKMLPPGELIKVKIRNTQNGYYDDLIKNQLANHGIEYYVMIEKGSSFIGIFIKFNDETEHDFKEAVKNYERIAFDFIQRSDFTHFCEIV